MEPQAWHCFRVRPANHPLRRIFGAAGLVSRFLETGLVEGLRDAATTGKPALLTSALAVPSSTGSGPAFVGLRAGSGLGGQRGPSFPSCSGGDSTGLPGDRSTPGDIRRVRKAPRQLAYQGDVRASLRPRLGKGCQERSAAAGIVAPEALDLGIGLEVWPGKSPQPPFAKGGRDGRSGTVSRASVWLGRFGVRLRCCGRCGRGRSDLRRLGCLPAPCGPWSRRQSRTRRCRRC